MTTIPYYPAPARPEDLPELELSTSGPGCLTKDHKRIAILYMLSITFFLLHWRRALRW